MELSTLKPECPESVSTLIKCVHTVMPGVKVSMEPGGEKAGNWWVDARLLGRTVTMEWEPRKGFRLYDPDSNGYGEGPMEVFRKPELAARRMAQFLQTTEASGSWLRQVRDLYNMPQTAIAEKLGVQQAAVSKLEKRDEWMLSTLVTVIESLGGTLEIKAHFPDCDLRLMPGPVKSTV